MIDSFVSVTTKGKIDQRYFNKPHTSLAEYCVASHHMHSSNDAAKHIDAGLTPHLLDIEAANLNTHPWVEIIDIERVQDNGTVRVHSELSSFPLPTDVYVFWW